MTGIVEIEELGRRLRKCRLDSRLTLKQVEESSGLSATHLSEIERGRTSPTLGALLRIARALGRDASYFIEREELEDVAHFTPEICPRLHLAPGVTVDVLTPGIPGSFIHAYRLRLEPGSGAGVKFPALEIPGEAIYMVRRGTLEASFGSEKLRLAAGDAAQATFAGPHHLRAAAGGPAEVIAVLTRAIPDPP